jgi:hypothetical protein
MQQTYLTNLVHKIQWNSAIKTMHLFLWPWFFWLSLLHKISTTFSILASGLCMLYHNFYFTFSGYLPPTEPGLKYLHSCSYADIGCRVIEVAVSNGPNGVDVAVLT